MSLPSVTTWIREMQQGNEVAEAELWKACWHPVVERARAALARKYRVVSDEEDLAAAVLESLFRRAKAGDYSVLNNSNDLWRLLWVIIERKAANQVEHCLAQRRNSHRTHRLSEIAGDSNKHDSLSINEILSDASQDEPAEGLVLAETLEQLMNRLNDSMRATAKLALDGHKPKEIAGQLNIKIWTVYNHLTHIRAILEMGFDHGDV